MRLANLLNWYPILWDENPIFFACFQDTLKLGMEQGLEGQTKGGRQGDFTNNSEI